MVKVRLGTLILALACLTAIPALAQDSTFFTPGNLVVAVEGCGVHGGTCTNVPNGTGNGSGNSSVGGYGDNQAAPLTLFQYTPLGTTTAAFVNSLTLQPTAPSRTFRSPASTVPPRRRRSIFPAAAST